MGKIRVVSAMTNSMQDGASQSLRRIRVAAAIGRFLQPITKLAKARSILSWSSTSHRIVRARADMAVTKSDCARRLVGLWREGSSGDALTPERTEESLDILSQHGRTPRAHMGDARCLLNRFQAEFG
jgi:hypothetical protein